eukprot:13242055-Alexandrium_andersonii.AAC.1
MTEDPASPQLPMQGQQTAPDAPRMLICNSRPPCKTTPVTLSSEGKATLGDWARACDLGVGAAPAGA